MSEAEKITGMNHAAAASFFAEAKRRIEQGDKEDVLRYYFCTCLPSMFPAKPRWIYNHALLAEGNTKTNGGEAQKNGFADVLLGTTAVEYEKNLTNQGIFVHGREQVQEYCAGLLNKGVDGQDIIGVLSDTVRWFTYDVEIVREPVGGELYGPDNIELRERDSLDMGVINEETLRHFEALITGAYDRPGTLLLTAEGLADRFGLTAPGSKRFQDAIQNYVQDAIDDNPSYAQLIQSLWDKFVTGVGTEQGGAIDFVEDYSREFYIVTLAKLICANVLTHGAHMGERDVVASVISGDFFSKQHSIENFVEYDYFGWLNESSRVDRLIDVALEMQQELLEFSYKAIDSVDLFGPLLSDLASKERRVLLGQAPTPRWLAGDIVEEALGQIDAECPRLLDMCCGSGVFVVETLRYTIEKLGNPQFIDCEQAEILSSCITGIDIDPLAVVLAKANWLIIMRRYLCDFPSGKIRIPIYHADSLFAATPVTHGDGALADEAYSLMLSSKTLKLPAFLFEPEKWTFTNALLAACENMAVSLAEDESCSYTDDCTRLLFERTLREHPVTLSEDEKRLTETAVNELGSILYYLQVNGQNGIWPFILSNGFIPAFMRGRFDGIVSNPPWLAMSRLADNPYSEALRKKAKELGVSPRGSSFLHTELATVFFVGASNRYLKMGGVAACVLPHSVLNGRHEEPFRRREYLTAKNKTQLTLEEIWLPPKDTFNNRSAVIFARKDNVTGNAQSTICGRIYDSAASYDIADFQLVIRDDVSAYSTNVEGLTGPVEKVLFRQGFDAFPRTALCFAFTRQNNGMWTVRSLNETDSNYYAIKQSKKAATFRVGERTGIEDEFVRGLLASNHVLAHYHSEPLRIFLPLRGGVDGVRALTNVEKALLTPGTRGLLEDVLACADERGNLCFKSPSDYLEVLDTKRNKLQVQYACHEPWLVVYGAGGQNITAAAMPAYNDSFDKRLLVDQTLYWRGCSTEQEARFYEGMLNCDVLNADIKDFQPEGNQGKRHIHTLPLKFLPHFNADDDRHIELANAVKRLDAAVIAMIVEDPTAKKIADPAHGSLPQRRTKFRALVSQLEDYANVKRLCEEIY